MNRKNFIAQSCKACVGIAIGSSIINLLSSCSPLPVYKTRANNKLIEVDISNFLPEKNMLVVKCKGIDFDLLLIKKTDGNYTALYMMCTHERQPLGATNKGLYCSSHGSAFDLEGKVTLQPATKNLIKYHTSIQDQKVIINLNQII
jgi:nitrite reductase/ring-hydroxylating ferredoxin subunit